MKSALTFIKTVQADYRSVGDGDKPPATKVKEDSGMGAIRASFAQFVAVARGEMRLTFAGAPALGWQVLISLAWGLTAIVLGCVIGLMAVVLPPMSVFGVVGLAALVLLWVMPDLNTEPYKQIRRMFFVALVVDLCLPTYYTIQIASLPWISARRVATFPLIVLFAVT